MRSLTRPALLGGLALVSLGLAACQGEKKSAEKGTAAGEILPGSASDAMLPYDTVRSQPPLAPMPTATGKAGTRAAAGEEDAAAAATDGASADAEPSPAAVPSAASVPKVIPPAAAP